MTSGGGVPAYSTLGWFNDPLLSTFIKYPDGELARLIFHELAHQTVYAPGDTPSMKVCGGGGGAGVARWLAARPIRCARPISALRAQAEFLALLDKYRAQLGQLRQRRQRRRQAPAQGAIFAPCVLNTLPIKESWNGYAGYDRWFAMPLSNAHLALVGTTTIGAGLPPIVRKQERIS
jgi:predicted aminopeptidase